MMKKIIVFLAGPIGKRGKAAAGGYAAANRRTIDLLQQNDVEVRELPYPVAGKSTCLIKKIFIHLWGFKILNIKLFFALLGSLLSKKKRIVHITGLYMSFIYLEFIIALTAKWLGAKLIYDIRAGAMKVFYKERSSIYRYFFNRVLSMSDQVMIEGEEYTGFIETITNKKVFYFPNYIDRAVQQFNIDENRLSSEFIKIIYFGWIKKTKGVEFIIEVKKAIEEKGHKVFLTFIGGGEEDYLTHFRGLISQEDNVQLIQNLPHHELMQVLRYYHYFLFPSTHIGEGHSNALTEAMANGLVPICSDNGFSRSVVGDSGRILPLTARASDYAHSLLEIHENAKWSDYSHKAYNRIKENYSSDNIISHLLNCYKNL